MLLSTVILLPLVFAVFIAFWPQQRTLRHLALGFLLIEFLIFLMILNEFDY